MSFGKLLKRAKARYLAKEGPGKWGRCEQCNDRQKLYCFYDSENQIWMLCSSCLDVFTDWELL